MKHIFLTLAIGLLAVLCVQHVSASTMVINNIEMTNFMPGPDVVVNTSQEVFPVARTQDYAIDFAPGIQAFQITILSRPYEESVAKAEAAFLDQLAITKPEACFLDVRVVAPASVNDGEDDAKLAMCADNKKADINSDGIINLFDYSICLDELKTQPTDLKMSCDLNMNRRVDAADLSAVISLLKRQ